MTCAGVIAAIGASLSDLLMRSCFPAAPGSVYSQRLMRDALSIYAATLMRWSSGPLETWITATSTRMPHARAAVIVRA